MARRIAFYLAFIWLLFGFHLAFIWLFPAELLSSQAMQYVCKHTWKSSRLFHFTGLVTLYAPGEIIVHVHTPDLVST